MLPCLVFFFSLVPQDAYASPRFRFVQVNLTEFDKRHLGMDWKFRKHVVYSLLILLLLPEA